MRTLLLALPALLPLLTGCDNLFGDKDAHQPGEQLGTFHVTGTRTSNTCGEGALGSTPTWEFDVDLAREDGVFYWDNGAQIVVGTLAEDGVTFSIEAAVVIDMRGEENLAYPPCSIERRDVAAGALASEGEAVEEFEGSLSYRYAPTLDSECVDLIEGEVPIFAALPCSMTYEMQATRIAAPE